MPDGIYNPRDEWVRTDAFELTRVGEPAAVTPEIIDEVVQSFMTRSGPGDRAPLVPCHTSGQGPRVGEMVLLYRDGNSLMGVAEVSPMGQWMIESGEWPARSVYMVRDPETGWWLEHLALLGDETPATPNLAKITWPQKVQDEGYETMAIAASRVPIRVQASKPQSGKENEDMTLGAVLDWLKGADPKDKKVVSVACDAVKAAEGEPAPEGPSAGEDAAGKMDELTQLVAELRQTIVNLNAELATYKDNAAQEPSEPAEEAAAQDDGEDEMTDEEKKKKEDEAKAARTALNGQLLDDLSSGAITKDVYLELSKALDAKKMDVETASAMRKQIIASSKKAGSLLQRRLDTQQISAVSADDVTREDCLAFSKLTGRTKKNYKSEDEFKEAVASSKEKFPAMYDGAQA